MRPAARLALVSAGLGFTCVAWAQDWTTNGFDAQRSFWLRADSKISVETVKERDFQHLWRIDLGGEAPPQAPIPGPVLLDFLISHRGFRSLAFLTGADGTVFAFDTDLARREWQRPLGLGHEPQGMSDECQVGTSSVTRPAIAAFPSMFAVGGFGPARRSPGVGAVGEPEAGAVTLGLPRRPPFRRPEPPKPGARQRPRPRRSLSGLSAVYALSPAGSLHTLLASNGMDHLEPIPFTALGAKVDGLIVVDGVAYVSTANSCGGVQSGVFALDIESKRVSSWEPEGGSVAGTAGPSMVPDGTLYVATTDGRVVALEAKNLREKDSVRVAGKRFTSSPVVMDIDGKDYLAVAADDGSVVLMNAADLATGALGSTRGYHSSTRFDASAVATWRDAAGSTWVLAPVGGDLDPSDGITKNGSVTQGAIAAWRIVKADGALAFAGGWLSEDLEAPQPPIVVNGVVFATAGGQQGPAILYALEANTGKVLWDSGATLGTRPAGGLSAGGNEVFVTTLDGGLHAFGFPIEH